MRNIDRTIQGHTVQWSGLSYYVLSTYVFGCLNNIIHGKSLKLVKKVNLAGLKNIHGVQSRVGAPLFFKMFDFLLRRP